MIWKSILFLLVAGAISWGIETYLKRKFKIAKRGFFNKPITRVHGIVEGILIIAYLVILWFVIENPMPYIVGFLTVMYAVRAFMEWKNEREKKQYILSMFAVVAIPVFMCVYLYIIS